MRICQYSTVTGQVRARSIPVTTADRSPTLWGFFISLRYSHSKNTQPMTLTPVSSRARIPKLKQPKISAGIMAMITSSMMERVVSLPRMWGEEVAMRFSFL